MQKLGRYVVLEELGRGAMGVVYKARDPKIDRLVAIKVISPEAGIDPDKAKALRDRFQREARAAGRLSHPNIVTIYDASETEGQAFLVMEFIEGKTLESLMQTRGLFSIQDVASITNQVAQALDYAHQQGIVHRDIKPANIMMTNAGVVKVADFGIARIADTSSTRTGLAFGTPSYMSPEQVAGHKVDGRSDQFCLGVMVYELLSGEKPFPGDSLTTVVYRIMQEDPIPLRLVNPALPEAVDTILKKSMAKNPADRYPRVSDFGRDLLAVASGEAVSVSAASSSLNQTAADGLDTDQLGDLKKTQVRLAAPGRDTSPTAIPPSRRPVASPPRRKSPWLLVVGGFGAILALGLVLFIWLRPPLQIKPIQLQELFLTKEVRSDGQPGSQTEQFPASDPQVFLFARGTDLAEQRPVQVKWFDPDGKEIPSSEDPKIVLDGKGGWRAWAKLALAGGAKPGLWRAKFELGNINQGRSFPVTAPVTAVTVPPPPPPAPAKRPQLQELILAKDVRADGRPVGPSEQFPASDPQVFLFARGTDLSEQRPVRVKWVDPDGKEIPSSGVPKLVLDGKGGWRAWAKLALAGSAKPGLWKTELVIGDDINTASSFAVMPAEAPVAKEPAARQDPTAIDDLKKQIDAIQKDLAAKKRQEEEDRLAAQKRQEEERLAAQKKEAERQAEVKRQQEQQRVASPVPSPQAPSGGQSGSSIVASLPTPTPQPGSPSPQPGSSIVARIPTPTPTPPRVTPPRPEELTPTVLVPVGEFIMGSSPRDGNADETPQRKIFLDAFYIDKYQTTVGRYAKYLQATGAAAPAYWNLANPAADGELPVIGVDWDQAQAYCKWAGKRLPTEAEWEKAARGTDGRKHPWGNQAPTPQFANYGRGGSFAYSKSLEKVGSYESGKSPYGAYDMIGNVWQWVADWYDKNYYQNMPDKNPKGPEKGESKVIRGGSWARVPLVVRAAGRNPAAPSSQTTSIGFRCAKDGQ